MVNLYFYRTHHLNAWRSSIVPSLALDVLLVTADQTVVNAGVPHKQNWSIDGLSSHVRANFETRAPFFWCRLQRDVQNKTHEGSISRSTHCAQDCAARRDVASNAACATGSHPRTTRGVSGGLHCVTDPKRKSWRARADRRCQLTSPSRKSCGCSRDKKNANGTK